MREMKDVAENRRFWRNKEERMEMKLKMAIESE